MMGFSTPEDYFSHCKLRQREASFLRQVREIFTKELLYISSTPEPQVPPHNLCLQLQGPVTLDSKTSRANYFTSTQVNLVSHFIIPRKALWLNKIKII